MRMSISIFRKTLLTGAPFPDGKMANHAARGQKKVIQGENHAIQGKRNKKTGILL